MTGETSGDLGKGWRPRCPEGLASKIAYQGSSVADGIPLGILPGTK